MLSTRLFRTTNVGIVSQRGIALAAVRSQDATPGMDVVMNGKIKAITLNRVPEKNAITNAMFLRLGQELLSANTDDKVSVITVTGAGETDFTAGTDLEDVGKLGKIAGADLPYVKYIQGLIDCQKPVIAIVNGSCLGLAVTMLGLYDIVLASDKATYNCPFGLINIPPEACSSYLFPKIMGHTKAAEMLFFNQKMSSQDLYERNLITRVYPHDKLRAEAAKRVEQMAKFNPKTMMMIKNLVRPSKLRARLNKLNVEEAGQIDLEIIGKMLQAILKAKAAKKK